MPYCKECGADVNETAKFCPKCGAKRTYRTLEPEERKLDVSRLKPILIVVGVIIAILFILAVGGKFFLSTEPETTTTTVTTQPAITIRSTTLAPTTSTVISTISTTISTTTTVTLPRYYPIEWHDMGKCKDTVLGKMNTFYVDIPSIFVDQWREIKPEDALLYICDNSSKYNINKVLKKGGSTVGPSDRIEGPYRIMVKCGHTARIDDLVDCNIIEIYFDRSVFKE